MIGTFDGPGNSGPSGDLVRHPFVDIANAPTDQDSHRLYEVWKFTRAFDANEGKVPIFPYGRKRSVHPID